MSAKKARAGKAKARPKPKTLDPVEWDFSQVPDKELSACFLWEYARESEWILDLSRRCQEHPLHTPEGERYFEAMERKFCIRNPKPKTKVPEWRDDFETVEGKKWLNDLSLVSNLNCSPIVDLSLSSDLPMRIQAGWILIPWQSLTGDQRHEIIDDTKRTQAECFPPLISIEEILIEDSIFSGIKKRFNGRTLFDSRNKPEGVHTFIIDWHSNSNDTIVSAFSKWIKENRKQFPMILDKRGNKEKDVRAWLKWLGVMRALHCFSLADHRFPKGLRCNQTEQKTYEMRSKAKRKFQELFGFLPGTPEPISFSTGR